MAEKLREGAERMGLPLAEEALVRLLHHHRLLSKWMDKVNLTTVRDPEGMAEKLYLDSAVLLRHLPAGFRMHDVGTGAGFPGLIVKALHMEADVTLSEARRKKVHFLRQAAREMGIRAGLRICERRLLAGQTGQLDRWDEVVSRATFPLEDWIAVGAPMVAAGGRLWIFSGQPHGRSETFEGETLPALREATPSGFEMEILEPYRLPFSGRERHLVALRRR